MSDHVEWLVQRTLSVQGITIEEVRQGDLWALRRDGEITQRGSDIEIRYAYDVIANTLAPEPVVVITGGPGWVSGPCP